MKQIRLKAVTSQDKYDTAGSMCRRFKECFEMELAKISQALYCIGGIKKTAKVHGRIGRARERIPPLGIIMT